MLTPAELWSRARERIGERDPEYDAARRAIRAALVLPVAAAVGFAIGSGSQTPLFAIFGSVALLITVDFPGNRPARALAYGGLGLNGFVLITIGSLVAPIPWLAVLTMFVLGLAVTFSGVLSEIVAAGQRSTLLTFVLPACTPVGPIDERLLGWSIALALAVPAALFLLPPRHHDELRRHAASTCRTLADRLEGAATADDVSAAMGALRANFLGADFRPVGLTAGSRALVRVVDDLQWLSDRITDSSGDLLAEMRDPVVAVLRESAQVLSTPRVADRDAHRASLARALAVQRLIAQSRYRDDIVEILGEPNDATRDRRGPQTTEPQDGIGLRRCHRTRHRNRRGGRCPAGVGTGPGPSAARVRSRRPGPLGVEGDHVVALRVRRDPGRGGSQQRADRSGTGARGRSHPGIPGAARILGGPRGDVRPA